MQKYNDKQKNQNNHTNINMTWIFNKKKIHLTFYIQQTQESLVSFFSPLSLVRGKESISMASKWV